MTILYTIRTTLDDNITDVMSTSVRLNKGAVVDYIASILRDNPETEKFVFTVSKSEDE